MAVPKTINRLIYMTQIEIGAFLSLFNRGGYVLDLTTDDFDALTMEAVGEALCSKYQLSKGKSLKAYLMEASDDKALDLLNALMNYYEQYSLFENETRDSDPLFGDLDSVGLYRKAYLKCKEILDKHRGVSANTARAEIIEDMFTTQYMRQQIRLMIEMQDDNPAEAIGKAKELIESCCKFILKQHNVAYTKDDGVAELASKAFDTIKIMPKYVDESHPNASDLKSIYGSLKGMVRNIANLRNAFGNGHGKEIDFQGLEPRHAHLIVGASITIVEFLWASNEDTKTPKSNSLF